MRPTVHVTSPAQERLWVLHQLGGGAAYNATVTLQLDGALDAGALRGGVVSLVDRHEALRTCLATLGDRPVQVVYPVVPLEVPYDEDIRGEAAARALFDADSRRPFDLASPPLLRARLVQLRPDRHLLNLCLHHSVFDEWSTGVLLSDLAVLYEAATRGGPAPQVAAARYRDYAVRQRRRLRGSRLRILEDYWRRRLAAAPEVLQLPTDRPRPDIRRFRGSWVERAVGAPATRRLADLARAERTTLFTVLLAGFAATLARHSGQEDVVVGTSVADRGTGEFDDVIGFFVTTVPLRVTVTGRPTFRELLRRVRTDCAADFAHHDLPFERVVDVVGPVRTTAYQPVFQVMLTLQSTESRPPRLADVEVTALRPASVGAAQFDLNLSVLETGAGLALRLQYDTDLFDVDTAGRLLEHLSALLSSAGEAPDRPVTTLRMVMGEERTALLPAPAGRGVRLVASTADCLPARVEAQAARTPDAVAVTAAGGQLTYRELDASANRLGRALVSAGVGPEALVGLAARRGPNFVTAIQAVWRAGGAFVPLDPSHPTERHGQVLRQSGCRVVVADEVGQAVLAELPDADRPVVVPLAPSAHLARSAEPLLPRHHPDNLAYVIFTSGTTGAPKGAMVTHCGMVNHVLAKTGDLAMAASDVLAQNGPATFDVVVWQCTAPLLLGGTVHVVADDVLADPERFAASLTDGGVTVLQAVPSSIGLLLASQRAAASLASLRWLVPTGDALPAELVRRWFAARPDVPLLNTYGVTECSDDQCHAVITAATGDSGPIATIGEPIPNMAGYVLDRELEPAPLGVPGELYLGGAGVGRGYRGQPGLTADRFVPDPFGAPGARLYRTGDVVRRGPGRPLEFLGRSDNQVKIRGYRVEPGEVEAALARHPAVREAVVVAAGEAGPGRRLAAYLVAAGEERPRAVEIRRFTATALPEHMAPDHVVWLDQLPLTAHGKIDRGALPAPEDTAGEHDVNDHPLDPIEETVATVWQRVLATEPPNRDDHFFDAGGNSLRAVALLNGLRTTCRVELTLADLLRDATVTGIAARVRTALRGGDMVVLPQSIPARPDHGPAPASFAQQRMWVIDGLVDVPALYTVPFSIQLAAQIDDSALRAAVHALVRRHEILRTGLVEQDGRVVQVVHDTVPDPLTITDLSGLPADRLEPESTRLLAEDARTGFALDTPPLVRVRAVRLGKRRMLLGVVLHHAVTDAWSNAVLSRDLVELIQAAEEGRRADLPPVPLRYGDFAAWQRARLTGPALAELVDHWTVRLAGAPELTTFPADRPRPPAQSYRGGVVAVDLPGGLAGRVTALARAEDATPFMVFTAALAVLLHRWSGQDDLVIGTPVAGRDHPQTHDSAGLFVNTVPLRLRVPPVASFREIVRHARGQCLDAYAHADLPFETLVDRMAVPRTFAHHPVFQVLLVKQDAPHRWGDGGRAGPGPTAHPGTVKFDLELHLVEEGDAWRVVVEYAVDRYDKSTAVRVADQFRTLLEVVTAEPEGPVGQVGWAASPEVVAWSRGPSTDPPEATLPALVAAQASATPHAPAIGHGDTWLSYSEFWSAVDDRARRLRAAGVGPESVVGVHLRRSIELVVTVHAVVAAGGAYLPLPTDLPAARVRLLVADARAELVLCDAAVFGRLAGCEARLADPAALPEGDAGDLPTVPADCAAYVIYTSGSTGRPKGVQVSHRAIVAHLWWMSRAFPPLDRERVLHRTSFGFDVSVLELFRPLIGGGTIVVGEREVRRDPRLLMTTLVRDRVHTVHFVPSMLGPFLDAVAEVGHAPPALRRLFSAGEELSDRLVAECHRLLPNVEVYNLYGPTEAAVVVTWHRCEPGDTASIGRPVDNTRVEILDPGGVRVPVGVRGELYLGGIQLARGYRGRPGQTADRFVPDPYTPGTRLYRTGDLGRWRADGTIEFLGRADAQVKVRGVRVEPAEVEAALLTHRSVREAAVVARGGRLVAYVVGPGEGVDAERDLRTHLTATLPRYLVPARFVVVDGLAKTASGKLDRAALPEVGPARPAVTAAFTPPTTDTERRLARIWARVLGVAQLGVHDNFFELGGDSIMSLLIVSRLAEEGLRITPRQFFDHQTVAELAAVATPVTASGRSRGARGVDPTTYARAVAVLRAQDQQTGEPDGQRR